MDVSIPTRLEAASPEGGRGHSSGMPLKELKRALERVMLPREVPPEEDEPRPEEEPGW